MLNWIEKCSIQLDDKNTEEVGKEFFACQKNDDPKIE
jgi:hypothetical protein